MANKLRTSGVFNLGSLGGDVAETVLDADFDSVTLLLDGTSATDDLSSVNQDASITNNGSITTTSLAGPSGYGTVSALDLNGSSQYLTTTYYTSSLFNQNFTIEGWFYIDNAVGNRSFFSHRSTSSRTDGVVPYITTSSTYGLVVGNGTAWQIITSGGSVTTGWHHIAVTRNGNDYVLWVDGNSTLTGTYSGTVSATGNFAIGAGSTSPPSQHLAGKIFDFRVTEGVARYSDTFTPPTSALSADVSDITGSDDVVLLLDGTSVNDGSTGGLNDATLQADASANDTTVTDPYGGSTGSYKLDGTGDYLSISDDDDFHMDSGDFTAECWAYFNSLSTTEPFIMGQWSGDLNAGTLNWAIMLSTNTGYVRFITSSNGNGVLFDLSTSTTSFSLSTSTWYHIAAVRNGSSFKIFVDGVERASTTNTSALYNATNAFTIGAESNGQQQAMNGYLKDIRVTKGAALYPFHPPISALPTTGTVAGATRPTRKWGGLVGRSLIASDALVKTGNLKLSELLQATYPAPGAESITYWLATAYEGGATTDGVQLGEVEVDSTGNMYLLSSMSSTTYGTDGADFVITKLNAAGEFQWHKLLAGAAGGHENFGLISSGGSLAVDGDDNLIVAQTAQDRNGATTRTGFVAKISPAGSIIWQRIQDVGGTDQSRGYACIADKSTNDIYVCGELYDGPIASTYSPYVVKYNSSGTEQWQISFGTTGGNQGAKGIRLDTNGDVLVSGQDRSGATRGMVAKLSKSTGAISWSRYIGNTTNNKGLNHMAMDGDDPIMVGFNQENSSGSNDLWLVKYNNSGTYQWGRLLGGTGNDQGYSIATDDSGNVYVGGFQASDVAHTSVTNTVLLAKYNSSGTIQWQKRFTADNNSGNISRITGITIHPDGSLILAISSYNGAGSDYSIQVMKLPIDDTLWPSTVGDWSIATSSLTDKAASSTQGSLSYTTSTNSITSSAGAMTISNPSASFTEVRDDISA